jgi:hypothetical protein
MRGPACFSNSSPAVAPVTITNTTNNYQIAGDQIAWRQERFNTFVDLVGANQAVVHPDTSYEFTASAYVVLQRAPITPYTVKVYAGSGAVRQRPLLAYSTDGGGSDAFDYFIIGDRLYFTFDPTGVEIFVDYVGIPAAGDPTALEVGAMQTILVAATDPADLVAKLPAGWVWADGTTVYSKIAHSALYAFLKANGDGTMIEHDADEAQVSEGYSTTADGKTLLDPGSAFQIPPGGFVIRYLAPYTFGPLPDPGVWDDAGEEKPLYRYRSTTARVAVKV